ncbi:MAG: hypothetical protein K2X07_09505 [Caulobacteraceae bacterium]|nr:hypothetical protein [Caulobacteraceae bacterium]
MTADVAPDAARLRPAVALLAVLIVAVEAFALSATGSLGVAGALIAGALHLAGFVGLLGSRRSGDGQGARVFLAGMALTASGLLGAASVARVLQPHAVTAGDVGVLAMVVASALSLTATSVPGLRRAPGRADPEAVADPSVVLVATVGLASAAFLGSPALDAAPGAIIALWLLWGGVDQLRAR